MYSKSIPLAAAVLMLLAACTHLSPSGIRRSTPERQGMSSAHLSLIDSTVNASIEAQDIPGAVIGIVHNGALVYEKAFGNKSLWPEVEPMTVETLFDLASLSKCVGTTISVMQLVEQGKLRLVDPVSYFIPEFMNWEDPKTKEKGVITVQHLLTHSSGLEAYLPDVDAYLDEFGPGSPDSLMAVIATRIKRKFRPGTQQLYSCLNFITLQHIVERITGERLCDYTQKHVFDALGLKHTLYIPLTLDWDVFTDAIVKADVPSELLAQIAPSEVLGNGNVLRGQVHDPIARLINLGNSGNAGVFSNVEDMAVICAALLNGGSYNGRRILSPLTVKRMFEVPQGNAPQVARALGWDCYYLEPYTSGDVFAVKNVRGHTGYTGTSVLLDPDTNTAVIILAHRVHPMDDGSVSRLRSTVASIAAAAIGR